MEEAKTMSILKDWQQEYNRKKISPSEAAMQIKSNDKIILAP
jgi:hypothetical protein